jgi:phosphoribosylanthranilate isomerase
MFRIKICGITTVEDAVAVAEAGADAVGLNFYPDSKRCVPIPRALMIANALGKTVVKVGVFVNAKADQVCQTFDHVGLDLVQLHGDEPPYFLRQLGGRPAVKAFRLGQEDVYFDLGQQDLYTVGRYLGECRDMKCMPRMTLVDANVEGAYGGTGQVADWEALKTYQPTRVEDPIPPLVLAGGLTPDNVAEAIRTVRPAAVDTASGIESSPGHKDRALVERFVQSARQAFEGLR